MDDLTSNGAGKSRKVRVLVVDDSAVVRAMLMRELTRGGIEVVGTAPDPYIARDKIVALRPDVLTLDVEMPRMDGITFLRKLMQYHPMPIIILSSLTSAGTRTAVEALSAGAVDVLGKPGSAMTIGELGPILVEKILQAARTTVRAVGAAPSTGLSNTVASLASSRPSSGGSHGRIVALGASTGGVQALTRVLTAFPAEAAPTVVVQHMPAGFTASFAERLNTLCAVQVKEASNGDVLRPGLVLLAPGGSHMVLLRQGTGFQVQIRDGAPVFHQKPSVDVLFHSVARHAGVKAVGAILTGMGADGASGLLAMRQAGATTFAQDESTSVVYGMPMEAMKCGAAQRQVPLDRMADAVLGASRLAA